jgi:hypothetical protein
MIAAWRDGNAYYPALIEILWIHGLNYHNEHHKAVQILWLNENELKI